MFGKFEDYKMDLKRLIATGALLLTSLIPKSTNAYASKSADGIDSIHPLLSSQLSAFLSNNSLLPEGVTFNLGAVKKGSIEEDLPLGAPDYLRSFHHFIHWNTGKGLWGILPSSSDWALSPDLQSATTFNFNQLPAPVAQYFMEMLGQTSIDLLLGGDHSWPRVVEEYQNGELGTNFGHIFHLICDATVPAHVRDDGHIGEAPFLEKLLENYYSEGAALWPTDIYEVWTDEHKFEIMNQLTPKPEQVPSFSSLSELFKDLAQFTGSNFYSDGSVDGTVVGLTEVMEGNKRYFVKEVEGKKVHVLTDGYIADFPDKVCLEDMWKVLGTKSLEYGVAAMNLLVEEPPVECTNECAYGQTTCQDNNTVMTCTNNDMDDCLEWAIAEYCSSGNSCLSGECTEKSDCFSQDSKTCSGNNVYWQDSCGNLESFVKTCNGDFYCANGDCVDSEQCISHYYTDCKWGSAYWFNSCGFVEDLIQYCDDKECVGGECISKEDNCEIDSCITAGYSPALLCDENCDLFASDTPHPIYPNTYLSACLQTCNTDKDCNQYAGLSCKNNPFENETEKICLFDKCNSSSECKPGFSCLPTANILMGTQYYTLAYFLELFCFKDECLNCSYDPVLLCSPSEQ